MLRLTPKDPQSNGLLDKLIKSGNLISAEIAARMMVADYPEHPIGWQQLSVVLHKSGQVQEALASTSTALQLTQQRQAAQEHRNLSNLPSLPTPSPQA